MERSGRLWGLASGVSRVRRWAMGIADKAVVWVARASTDSTVAVLVRVAAGVLASQNGLFFKAGLVQNCHFLVLVRVRALGRSKTPHL